MKNKLKLNNYILLLFSFIIFFYNSLKSEEIIKNDFVKISLNSSLNSVGNLNEIILGLQFDLKPGWKVYWRSPGDAGLPTELSLLPDSNKNLSAEILYPIPERFTLFGLQTYGYSEKVIFPIIIKRKNNTFGELEVKARVNSLICSNICIPVEGNLSLNLSDAKPSPSEFYKDIAFFKSRVPTYGTGRDISIRDIKISDINKGLNINLDTGSNLLKDIIIESKISGIGFGKPKKIDHFNYFIPIYDKDINLLKNEKLVLTIITDEQFKEISYKLNLNNSLNKSKSWFYFLAFLGGVILNLMPCVLPVLCLKLTSLILISNLQVKQIRLKLFNTALGILLSFVSLSLLLILLKFWGYKIGWGFQFQSPFFIFLIIIFMYLFLLNIFDKLIIPIPSYALRVSNFSDFASGFVATMLAIPCSAPFVGTAISFAFLGTYIDLLLIMVFMSFGLALPYIILIISPKLVNFLPKPGIWMSYLKIALGLGLFATIIWLKFLLFNITNNIQFYFLIFVILLIPTLVLYWNKFFIYENFKFLFKIRTYIFILLIISLIFIDYFNKDKNREMLVDSNDIFWGKWSTHKLENLIKKDKLVFVDVTADWCITCKINMELAIKNDQVLNKFKLLDVVLLKADWTKKNEDILEYLIENDRFGIPFNIVYGPNLKKGFLLPEILNVDDIIYALEKVRN